jgi:PAS domain S-box-containing protein
MTVKRTGPRTVANDLLFWLYLAIFTTILVVGLLYYSYTTKNILSLLIQRAETTENEIIQVLSPQLFYMDTDAVRHTTEVFLASGRLSGIKIVDETGKIIIARPLTATSLIPSMERTLVYNDHNLGKIRLWFDDQQIKEVQKQIIITILVILITTFVAIAVAIRFILQSVLVKPLSLLEKRIEELASGAFEGHLPPVPQSDLNSIMVAVNDMATQLSDKTSQLILSEERYREIFNATGEAIFIHDAETGKILDVNNTMLTMYGYDQNEVPLLTLGDLSSGEEPYTQQNADFWVNRAVREGSQVFEWHARRKNGEFFWVEVGLKRTSIGGKGRVLAVVRDISSRKESENEVLREKKFSETIINSLPGLFYVYDENMLLIQWNRGFEDISGYSADELRNKHVFEWFDEGDKPIITKALQQVAETGKADAEASLIFKDGSKCPFFLSGCKMTFEDSTLLVGVGLDLSGQRQIEEELRQAQKMEAIGTLAGGIAHDFNNILTVISGYTELASLKLGSDPAKAEKDLKEVFIATNRAKDLVQQILTFSRKTEKQQTPLKLSSLLKESLKMLRPMLPTTIEIKQQIDSQDYIMADPTQIHQIIMNLCTNAYSAMQESGGTLEVDLHTVEIGEENPVADLKSGRYLQLMVIDNGIGMPEEIKSKIFEPYYTTKEKGKGTGLGLAVTLGIVKSHNGYIKVESESGVGSTFEIYFPVFNLEHHDFSEEGQTSPLKGGSEKIMFVDDEEQIVNLSNAMLKRFGYSVSIFNDSRQALREFERSPENFDLVITDMTMPHLNGMQLAMELMKIKPNVPIILCTGHSELISEGTVLAAGINYMCEKPFHMGTFIGLVRQVLDAG